MYVCMHTYKTKSLCCTPENDTVLQINYSLMKNEDMVYSENSLEKEPCWRNHPLWLQAILQRYSKQKSMVLAQN